MDTTILCDAKCWSEFKLPAAASTSVTSDKIILSEGKLGDAGIVDYLGELVVIVPALTATICPDGKTVTVQNIQRRLHEHQGNRYAGHFDRLVWR